MEEINKEDLYKDKKHGDIVKCPTCGDSGHLDIDTPDGEPIPFSTWVAYNPHCGGWECHYCWLK
jgi:hypothetical protein